MLMTFEEFKAKYLHIAGGLDWDGAYAGQCVDLFRYYCSKVLGIRQPDGVWGAANFWTDFDTDEILKANFTKIKNSRLFKPKAGDVMVWDFDAGGGFGHIGIVADDNATLSYFNSMDQNWSKIDVVEIVKHNYDNPRVFGVLRPKKVLDKVVELPEATFSKLVHNSSLADQTVNYLGLAEKADDVSFETVKKSLEARDGKLTSCKNELSTRGEELAKALSEVENRTEQVGRLKDELTSTAQLHKDELIALKSTQLNPEALLKPFKSRIEELESKLKSEAKAKGIALNDLSETKAKLENALKAKYPDLTIVTWLRLLSTVKWS